MSDATIKAPRAKRHLLPLLGKLERYMARAGLIAFMADPAAPAPAEPAAPAAPPPAAPDLLADPPADPAAPPADPAKPADPKDPKAADPADPKEPKEDDKPAGAPEKYEAFTLPEGVKLNESVMGEFQQLAKDLNLPQEAAQKLVDLGARMQGPEAMQAVVEAQGEQWAGESKVDKEFGGDKFDENLAVAKKALDQFGTPELKSLLVTSKLGNHPEVLRFFVRAGKAISEDGFVPGRGNAGGKATPQSMYAASNMNP